MRAGSRAGRRHWRAASPRRSAGERGGAAVSEEAQEGSNVFALGGHCWMITDPWDAFGVYRSDDLEHWTKTGNILGGAGVRDQDGVQGAHADVVTLGLAYDIDALHDKADLIPADWQRRLPDNSSPYTSTLVLVVR